MITDEIEETICAFIKQYCRKLKGVHFKGIGGTRTHVHLAVQVEPFVCPSELIGKLKGASSREVNERFRHGTLRWQKGYGVVTFAEKNLPAILSYISDQKEHHARGTTRKALETCQAVQDG
jgi:putative transposase